mmetsp:Transcript_22845/g.63710  ORF Transcript_22845/g.63710 Transcript_22845/m.63710 type:complete len:95 (-) Transcript_22845:98-382(-)
MSDLWKQQQLLLLTIWSVDTGEHCAHVRYHSSCFGFVPIKVLLVAKRSGAARPRCRRESRDLPAAFRCFAHIGVRFLGYASELERQFKQGAAAC